MKYPIQEAEEEITNILSDLLKKHKISIKIKLEIPPDKKMGDFSFPCFSLSKNLKKPPNKIAEELTIQIQKSNIWIDRVVNSGPYINFYLNKEKLINDSIKNIIEKKEKYGYLKDKKQKVIVEHTSANPNGPLHVGRARNPIIGDTIFRIYRAAGYNVESQFYLDDLGKQVGILAWGTNNISSEDLEKYKDEELRDYDFKRNKSDHENVVYYQIASNRLKEDEQVQNKLAEIVKLLEEGDEKTIHMIHKAYNPVLEGIKDSMKCINIKIDSYIPESKFVKDKSVDDVVEKLKKSENCGNDGGAYFIDMGPYGIQGRNTKFFFTRSDGTTLYATRDIAYHLWKAENADILINILGEDHKLESKQVEIALNLVGSKIIPIPIFYSFVSLPGGKMSTRRGRVVYLDDLIQECVNRAYEEVKKRRGKELTEEKMKEISEIVGTGAIRYNIIKVQPEKDIVFKWEEALNFEGNSCPFIQYAHARACSILRKNNEKITKFESKEIKNNSEIKLIKKLSQFPNIIKEASEGFKPHIIPNYLFEVASEFNQFYRDCPVLSEEKEILRHSRLKIVESTKIVLKNGLDLIGVNAPEEM